MIKIDKNIPLPEMQRKPGKSIYPLETMAVGDSFFTTKSNSQIWGPIGGVRKRTGYKYATRRWEETGDQGETIIGLRVWRIA